MKENKKKTKRKLNKKDKSIILICCFMIITIILITPLKDILLKKSIDSLLEPVELWENYQKKTYEKKMKKMDQEILDKLEKKYGEKFKILEKYYDNGLIGAFMGDTEECVVVSTQDDSNVFKVEVDFDTYSVYGDTYMAQYLYPKYEEHIKKVLYDEYADKVTLDDVQASSKAYTDNITKDTPIEKIPYQVFDKMISNVTLYVSEEMLEDSSPKEVVYKIARTMAKNNMPTMMYIAFVKKDIYHYGIKFDKYYYEDMSEEKRREVNKKFFAFFSKNYEPYERKYYWISVFYDKNKKKFAIDDSEEDFLKDPEERKITYIE